MRKLKAILAIGLCFCLSPYFANSQPPPPDFTFTSPSLVSGTALQVGAIYRFSNVKPGIDARVQIIALAGGLTLSTIDNASGGFAEALQPTISIPANSIGFAEFEIRFVQSGTTTLSVQNEVAITPIDIDGQDYSGLKIYEYDEIQVLNGYTAFQYAGSELDIQYIDSVWVRGKNIAGVDYPGIDTAQKSVMFSTVNPSISVIRVRVGADNRTTAARSRLRSFYFRKFIYPHHFVLQNKASLSISGTESAQGIILKGQIIENLSFDRIILERGLTSDHFTPIAEQDIRGLNKYEFTYLDRHTSEVNYYYRLRATSSGRNSDESSKIILIRSNNGNNEDLRLIGNLVNRNSPVVTIQSKSDGLLKIKLVNLNGHILYSNQLKKVQGTQQISLGTAQQIPGYYVLVLESDKESVRKKILIR